MKLHVWFLDNINISEIQIQSVKTNKKDNFFSWGILRCSFKGQAIAAIFIKSADDLTDYRAVYDVCAFDELGYWFRYHDSLRKNENEFFRLIDYVDVKHQAENIKAEVVMVIGPKDTVVFSKKQMAAFNRNNSKEAVGFVRVRTWASPENFRWIARIFWIRQIALKPWSMIFFETELQTKVYVMTNVLVLAHDIFWRN